MSKIWWTIQGYVSCLGWVISAIWRFLLESCVELRFWKNHQNLDDHIWYAERVNGRLAMIALTTILILELVSHHSIWDLLYAL